MDEQIKILEDMKNDYLVKVDALDYAIRQLKDKKQNKTIIRHTEETIPCPSPQVPFPVQGRGIRVD